MGCQQSGRASPELASAESEDDGEDDHHFLELEVGLLGSDHSGKSTVFEQLQRQHPESIHGDSQRRVEKNIAAIRRNIVKAPLALWDQCLLFGDIFTHKISPVTGEKFVDEAVDHLSEFPACAQRLEEHSELRLELQRYYSEYFESEKASGCPASVLQEMPPLLKRIWQLPSITHTLNRRFQVYPGKQSFMIEDNVEYWIGKLDAVFANDYTPTEEDTLRRWIKTSAYKSVDFDLETVCESTPAWMKVLDMAGMRSERMKWALEFPLDAIIFVAPLNGFNLSVYDRSQENAMMESVHLFSELITSKYMRNAYFLLFLNKFDLFQESLRQGHSLSVCFHREMVWNECFSWEGPFWEGPDWVDVTTVANDTADDGTLESDTAAGSNGSNEDSGGKEEKQSEQVAVDSSPAAGGGSETTDPESDARLITASMADPIMVAESFDEYVERCHNFIRDVYCEQVPSDRTCSVSTGSALDSDAIDKMMDDFIKHLVVHRQRGRSSLV